MSTIHAGRAHGLEEQGMHTSRPVHWNLSTAALYEHAIRRERGRTGRRRAARLQAPARTPAGHRTTSSWCKEPSSEAHIAWGKVNKPIEPTHFDDAQARHAGAPRRPRALRPGPVRRRRPDLPPAGSLHPGARLAEPVRPQPVHRPAARRICAGFAPQFTVITAPSFKAQPERHGTRSDVAIVAQPRHARSADCRHELRRREQEVDLHGPQLPAAAAGRAVDALLGEHRRERRHGALLRPVGHRQDDAVVRSRATADRRRRARLERQGRLQLRGRLLREDDPAVGARPSRRSTRRRAASAPCSRTS